MSESKKEEKVNADKFCATDKDIDALLRTMKGGKKASGKDKPKPPKVVEGNQNKRKQ